MNNKIYFTADTHFGHGNIIKYCDRQFLCPRDLEYFQNNGSTWVGDRRYRMSRESVEMMDDCLIDNINKTVGVDDTLWHLGDFAFGIRGAYYESCKRYRDRIHCRNLNICWGNHDQPREIYGLFSEDHVYKELAIDGTQMTLLHYAMAIWNKSHRGNLMLYGHSHSGAEDWLNKAMPGRRSMDVGVDNAYKLVGEYRPFSFEEIKKILVNKQGFYMDHHRPNEE